MVTTRRGHNTSREPEPEGASPAKAAGKKHAALEHSAGGDGEPEPESASSKKASSSSAARKKHKAPEQEAGEGGEGEGKGEGEPEKKKVKATAAAATSTTSKQVLDVKTGGSGKKATVEEVEDSDGGKRKVDQGGKAGEVKTEGKKQEGEEREENKKKEENNDTEMVDAPSKSGITVSSTREQKVSDSPILEKGVVYFFLRGKVNIEHPSSMDDVKRSYMILRPLPQGAKLVDGKLEDAGENRLIAIPKKRLPKRGYEKFLTFVEEPNASLEDLRGYLKGRTYQTKTVGERTDYPAQPIGEGVYAITKSDNERQSHFVYMLTIPEKPNELQEDFGLKEQGSFVISVRNPQTPSPPNAALPDPAEYPKEVIEEFKGLRWGSVQPKHFVKNAEFLFIGENKFPEDGDHEGTADEVGQLEEEDEKRILHLKGNESVFADLELDRKEFMGIQTTWGKNDDEV